MAVRDRPWQHLDPWERAEGNPWPPGVVWLPEAEAWSFALYSRHASAVELCFFDPAAPEIPALSVHLDPFRNRTGRTWHVVVPHTDVGDAVLYGYVVDGPWDPVRGHRFDKEKILLDPFADRVWFPHGYDRRAARHPGSTLGKAPLGVLPPPGDESGVPRDEPRPRHTADLIVYELHVRGFTIDPSSGVAQVRRGTFAGLADKIPYLKELGVTAVELLPVHQTDPEEGSYWGYMTLNFFAPNRAFAASIDPALEFRRMVRAFHEAEIEVWLDVVYNHTSEGDEHGPTHSFRGIDNRSYYLLEKDGSYLNASGTGNTFRSGHPAGRVLIVQSLDRWADQYGVDGFRFDLASILTRTATGEIDPSPAVISEISSHAGERDIRLVAEAWDIGAYQLGQGFPGITWRQWNGRYRDDVRSFVRGDAGYVGALMSRVYGSSDLFPDGLPDTYRPWMSVNFITAHDGFTLWDLVSYDRKHNEPNGHGNTDGADDNRSWNHGWEGDDGAPETVLALRRRQVRNFAALLLLSNGTPMILAGDEFGRTQGGNNNPYNQDNATSWVDWTLLEKNGELFRFWKLMIAFRKAHPSLGRSRYWRDDVTWFGPHGEVDFSPESRSVGWTLAGASQGDDDLCILVNASAEPVTFTLPGGPWRRAIDTALPSPDDIAEPGADLPAAAEACVVHAHAIVVLVHPVHRGGAVPPGTWQF